MDLKWTTKGGLTLEGTKSICRGAHGGKDTSSVTDSGTHLLNCIVDIREMLARLEVPNIDIVV